MSRYAPLFVLFAIMATPFSIPAEAITQDDLSVRMIYVSLIEQGKTNSVTLHVSSQYQKHPMKINWTGLHLDWQMEDAFFENTTQFELSSGHSLSIGLYVQCPWSAAVGKHSDYILIEYLVQDGPNGTWNEYMWMSEETQDFEVALARTTTDTANNTAGMPSAMLTIGALVVVVLVVFGVVVVIASARRKKVQPAPPQTWPDQYGLPPAGVPQTASPQYGATQYPPAGPPVLSPGTTAWICTECGSPATGASCGRCGHVRGG